MNDAYSLTHSLTSQPEGLDTCEWLTHQTGKMKWLCPNHRFYNPDLLQGLLKPSSTPFFFSCPAQLLLKVENNHVLSMCSFFSPFVWVSVGRTDGKCPIFSWRGDALIEEQALFGLLLVQMRFFGGWIILGPNLQTSKLTTQPEQTSPDPNVEALYIHIEAVKCCTLINDDKYPVRALSGEPLGGVTGLMRLVISHCLSPTDGHVL